MSMNNEYDELTDKLLEVSMKLKAAQSELETLQSRHEKELSQFAHNLKNPVGVVTSFAEMLRGSTSIDDEKRAKYLDIIQSSSQFSLNLVNSFQEYNKLSNGKDQFELNPVNFNDLIKGLISDASEMIKGRNQSLELNMHCSSSSVVELDRQQFRIAFLNLIQNASRFSNENSVIHIAVEEFENTLTITISDSGIGISEEDLPKLTNTFFTVNTYDEFKEKCIGLGLTKTELILSQMNGEMSISSELEKGTQVKILLKKV